MASQEVTDTTVLWDGLHSQRRHLLNYPSEEAVRFLVAVANEHGVGKGLDVGCGAGRHMSVMKSFGFEPHGVDSSSEALEQAAKHGTVVQGDMRDLPYPDDEFAVAVCLGTAYYGTRDDTVATVREIHRVLKPGGWVLLTLRTYRDWRCGHGDEIAPMTYRLEIPGEPEHGMVNNFFTVREAVVLGDGWSKMSSFELTERTTKQLTRLESDFRVTLQK